SVSEPARATARPSRDRRLKSLLIPLIVGAVIVVGLVAYFAWRSRTVTTRGSGGGQTSQSSAPEGMVLIEGGDFMMGRNDGRVYKGTNLEGPAHPETVSPFFLDIYEVTNRQYKEFVDARN